MPSYSDFWDLWCLKKAWTEKTTDAHTIQEMYSVIILYTPDIDIHISFFLSIKHKAILFLGLDRGTNTCLTCFLSGTTPTPFGNFLFMLWQQMILTDHAGCSTVTDLTVCMFIISSILLCFTLGESQRVNWMNEQQDWAHDWHDEEQGNWPLRSRMATHLWNKKIVGIQSCGYL